MKKIVLVFSTETTGKPIHFANAEEDHDNYPDVIHFCAELFEIDSENLDSTVKVLYAVNLPVKPIRNGKRIKQYDTVSEICKTEGEEMFTIALLFQGLVSVANVVICHNWQLDRNIMASELLRFGIKPLFKAGSKTLCIMKYSTEILKLSGGVHGKHKWPTLSELLFNLTQKNLKEHYPDDLLGNVEATKDCFMQLIKVDERLQKWIKDEINNIY